MLTLGYLGNGKSTNRYHLPYVLQLPELFRVKAVQSRSGSSAWPPVPGVQYTTRLDEVLDDPEVDLVVVTTPFESHVDLARAVLEAGKHALVEKPFAATADQARELFDLAGRQGLFLQCYQNRRFDSDFLTVQEVVASGVLGELLEVEMHYDYFRPEVPTRLHPRFDLAHSYLYGHACHTLDQVIGWLGRPHRTHFDVRQLLGPGRMNDYFDIDLYYDHPLKVSVKSSYFRLEPRPSFVATGTRGSFTKAGKDRQEEHLKLFHLPGSPGFGLDLPEHWGTLSHVDDAGLYHREAVPTTPGDYGRLYRGVHASIVDGAPKVVPDEDTIVQLELLEQGIHALRGEA